jgi:hypothetical protein
MLMELRAAEAEDEPRPAGPATLAALAALPGAALTRLGAAAAARRALWSRRSLDTRLLQARLDLRQLGSGRRLQPAGDVECLAPGLDLGDDLRDDALLVLERAGSGRQELTKNTLRR